MKYIKTFESFDSVNEEEAFFGLIADKQKKISEYITDVISGKFEKIEELKKDIKKYVDAKPDQGLGSAMGRWMNNISNINDIVKSPKKPSGQLEDAFGKMRPASDVLSEEIARIILKDRSVIKSNDKWEVNSKGRSFGTGQHTFGSGT